MLRVFDLIGLLAALQVDTQFVRRLDGRIDQVANDLMAVGRDADFLAAAHQLANHLRASEGLARAGRSLDRENAARQMAAEPNSGFNRRLSRAVQRLIADPRAFSEQEIARRLIRPIPAHAVVGDIVADPHQRLGHYLAADIAVGERGLRMEAGGVLSLLDIDGVVRKGDRLDLAELGAAEIAELLAAANLRLLRWKAVTMDRRLGGAAGRADKDETGESGALLAANPRPKERPAGNTPTTPPFLPGGANRQCLPRSNGPAAPRPVQRNLPEHQSSVFRSAR